MAEQKITTQFLRNFLKNDYMCWHVCTQCMTTGVIEVKDDKKTYFSVKKTNPSTELQHLAQGSAYYEGGSNLRVEIKVDTPYNLDVSKVAGAIVDKESNNVGFLYDFCVEDGYDKDYNDYYVNIVAWNKKG